MNEEITLNFFKTFAHAERMRLAAMLLESPATAEQICVRLEIRPADLPRYLHQIQELGLLIQTGDAYAIDAKALEGLPRAVFAGSRPQAFRAPDVQLSDEDRKVVQHYCDAEGRLKEIPSQEKKQLALLRYVAQSIPTGQRFSEKEINVICVRFFADAAYLRRSLIDHNLLERERNGSAYWRAESSNAS